MRHLRTAMTILAALACALAVLFVASGVLLSGTDDPGVTRDSQRDSQTVAVSAAPADTTAPQPVTEEPAATEPLVVIGEPLMETPSP